MKRGLEHFFDVGVVVIHEEGEDVVEDPYFERAKRAYLREEQEYGTRMAKTAKVAERKRVLLKKGLYGEKEEEIASPKLGKKRRAEDELEELPAKRRRT